MGDFGHQYIGKNIFTVFWKKLLCESSKNYCYIDKNVLKLTTGGVRCWQKELERV